MDYLCTVGTLHQSEGGVASFLLIGLLADLTYCRQRKARLKGTQRVTKQTHLKYEKKEIYESLTERHCRSTQVCLSFPGPPNFFMSLQKLHSPHSGLIQASQRLHLQRRNTLNHINSKWMKSDESSIIHSQNYMNSKRLKM